MKMRHLFFTFLITLSTNLFAGFLSEGGLKGTHNEKEEVNLLLKKVEGREGSFVGVLIKDTKRVSLYMIDEISNSSYSMTPLEVTKDGEIGMINDDPTLVLSTTENKRGQKIVRIMSANSSNNAGFSGYFDFDDKKSKYSWQSVQSGLFQTDKEKSALTISGVDPVERDATALFMTKNLSGTFTIREKFPAMFLINKNSVLATGVNKAKAPSAIMIFLNRKGFFGGSNLEVLMVNPSNDQDVTLFTESSNN